MKSVNFIRTNIIRPVPDETKAAENRSGKVFFYHTKEKMKWNDSKDVKRKFDFKQTSNSFAIIIRIINYSPRYHMMCLSGSDEKRYSKSILRVRTTYEKSSLNIECSMGVNNFAILNNRPNNTLSK